MGVIYVNEIEVYAHHGCLEEEAVIGGKYMIDAVFHVDVKRAAQYDDLDLTIDYVKVTEIVQKEMSIRAKLIESVGYKLIFLPPYSPDLNPIEKFWANMKRWIKARINSCDRLYNALEIFFNAQIST